MSSSEYLRIPSFNWKTAIHKTDGGIICELRSQIEKQSERIKELEAERGDSQFCAGCNDAAKTIAKQSAALKLAKSALENHQGNYVLSKKDCIPIEQALAAIDALGEVK